MKQLIQDVKNWAIDKDINYIENTPKQLLKTVEEFGEAVDAYLNNDKDACIDGIGDTFVTLIILNSQLGNDSTIFDNTDAVGSFSLKSSSDYHSAVSKAMLRIIVYIGQLSSHIVKGRTEAASNLINYILLSVTTICDMMGLSTKECLQTAYDVISKRTGKTINGVFVKSEDLV